MDVSTGTVVYVVVSFVLATALGLVLTPLAGRIGIRAGAIDRPAEHRPRSRPIPRTGGLAVSIAFVVVGMAAVWGASATGSVPGVDIQPGLLGALFGGVLLAAVLGFLDDKYDLTAPWQFLAQIVLASIAVFAGLRIARIENPFAAGDIRFDEPFAIGVTVIWIVGLINSINFVDGLDGLSGGIAFVAAVTLGLISLSPEIDQPFVTLLCAVLAGALLGFLRWNFHPAHIFIGTTGVFVVGYALGILSILGTAKVAVALLVLGVPIIDTFWIIVRRVLAGQSPFAPDRTHLNHRLLDLGLSHRNAVLLVYVICTLLALLSLVLTGAGRLYFFLGIVVGGGLILQLMTRRAKNALRAASYDEEASPGEGS